MPPLGTSSGTTFAEVAAATRGCYLPFVFDPLPLTASPAERAGRYSDVERTIESLLEGETDWVAAKAAHRYRRSFTKPSTTTTGLASIAWRPIDSS